MSAKDKLDAAHREYIELWVEYISEGAMNGESLDADRISIGLDAAFSAAKSRIILAAGKKIIEKLGRKKDDVQTKPQDKTLN